MNNSFRMYMRLIRYVNPRWRLTITASALTFACILLNLFKPYLISLFIDDVLIHNNKQNMLPILGLWLLVSIVIAGLTLAGFSIFRFLETRNMLDLRSRILSHIRKIPLPEIEKHGVGKFVALMGMDTDTTARFINVTAVDLAKQWLQMFASLAVIFMLDWRFGLVAVASIPVVIGVPRLFKRPARTAVAALRSHNEDIGSYLYESIQGSREIRTYGLEQWEERRNETMYKNLVKVSLREGLYRMSSGQSGSLIVAVAVVLIYGFGSTLVTREALSVGLLIAAVQYMYNVLNPVESMNYLISDLIRSEVAMGRIEAFLNSPVEALAVDQSRTTIEVYKYSGASHDAYVELRDMHVSFEGVPILKGIDLAVRKGQVAAFVGRSGSGKSTLFKALQGFMPITNGQLLIEQMSLDGWSRSAVSRKISFVSQETFLFSGSLYENVALGKLDATEDEVYRALCEVDLQTFVDELPQGIHTQIDNQGFRLSGGQRQRLAIARAIIKKPDILILDEPTSALDRHTEEQVLETIGKIMQGKTTFISTHRLESIRYADVIFVMEHGTVVDSGTHVELMQRCSLYVQMVKANELLKETAAAV